MTNPPAGQARHPEHGEPSRPPVSISPELRLAGRINRLALTLERPFQQHVATQYGISLPEWRTLVQTCLNPGIVASEIAAETALPAMSVSRSVQALRSAKHITAITDPADSRRRQLFPTDAGRELYETLKPQAVADITRVIDALNTDEQSFFLALVERLNQRSDEFLD